MIDSPARARRRNKAGFTLVEVLGAVAILGLSYMMLATSAIQGLRMIGESQRRIEASLLADETLAEIEIAIKIGQPIDVGYEEREAGPFSVDIEILDVAAEYETEAIEDEPHDLLAFLSAEAQGPFAPFRDANLLLGYLREVHITVRWRDAADELEVTRTVYVYDQQASQEHELESQPQGQELSEEGESELQRTISEALP
ncbi:MAG: prepilin-type N-terminal cleavage/methylation domain-containing protein [Deltaproteobacteria bacterium]|nr:prepilin-type N-terminal cleavage/methylation domain-containing protein [Deltaproteobacteria bacterium]MBW2388971.1 prepilin-type N-terminal cleavage/methylation domain-containing protein [Deltaproteobacteria bacterium]